MALARQKSKQEEEGKEGDEEGGEEEEEEGGGATAAGNAQSFIQLNYQESQQALRLRRHHLEKAYRSFFPLPEEALTNTTPGGLQSSVFSLRSGPVSMAMQPAPCRCVISTVDAVTPNPLHCLLLSLEAYLG